MANAKKILTGDSETRPIERQVKASEAVKAGMLLDIDTDGKFVKHAVAGGSGVVLIALPDPRHSNVDVFATATAFADGDRIRAAAPQKGDTVMLWLEPEQTITRDEYLQSNGAGLVEVAVLSQTIDESGSATSTIYPSKMLFKALEAVTTGAGETKLIRAMVV
jgi:hypothetical protein